MPDDPHETDRVEPDTESSEHPEDEAPTEEQEGSASETQVSGLATVEILADELEDLRTRAAERDDLLDRLQRTKADFINYQKRIQRERERWNETAVEGLCIHLLPVLDDLDRALTAAEEEHDLAALTDGIKLIRSKLLKALADVGVEPMDAQGQPFDPAVHEAVAHLHNPDVPHHSVVEELRRGYRLGERVLRAAQVVVATGGEREPPEQPPRPADEEETDEMSPGRDESNDPSPDA